MKTLETRTAPPDQVFTIAQVLCWKLTSVGAREIFPLRLFVLLVGQIIQKT